MENRRPCRKNILKTKRSHYQTLLSNNDSFFLISPTCYHKPLFLLPTVLKIVTGISPRYPSASKHLPRYVSECGLFIAVPPWSKYIFTVPHSNSENLTGIHRKEATLLFIAFSDCTGRLHSDIALMQGLSSLIKKCHMYLSSAFDNFIIGKVFETDNVKKCILSPISCKLCT